MATALSIVQDAINRLCVAKTPTTLDVTDDTQRQMLALLNEEGKELTASFDWQVLVKESLMPAADDSNQMSDQGLIEDRCPGYKRICNNCLYLDGRAWPLIGPLTIADRTYSKAGGMSFLYGYYIQNGHLFLTQSTRSTEDIRIAYISRWWAIDEQGNGLEMLTKDTDEPLLDSRLLTLGVVWRWLSRNGLPYQQEWLNYNAALIQMKAGDRPHAVLSAARTTRSYNPRQSIVGGTATVWA